MPLLHICMAPYTGFEPASRFRPTVFKTGPFSHLGTSAYVQFVDPVEFEPTTFRLEGECSIQLSYILKYWLGRLDSNQSMQESKSCALPAWLRPNI